MGKTLGCYLGLSFLVYINESKVGSDSSWWNDSGFGGDGCCREYGGIAPSVCSPRLFCSGRSSVRLEYLDLSELPGMVEESSCFGADNLQGNERSIFVFVEALLSYFMTQTCFFQVHCQNTL